MIFCGMSGQSRSLHDVLTEGGERTWSRAKLYVNVVVHPMEMQAVSAPLF